MFSPAPQRGKPAAAQGIALGNKGAGRDWPALKGQLGQEVPQLAKPQGRVGAEIVPQPAQVAAAEDHQDAVLGRSRGRFDGEDRDRETVLRAARVLPLRRRSAVSVACLGVVVSRLERLYGNDFLC